MPVENPTPKNMPPRKRRVAAPRPSLLDEQGWPSGKSHMEIVDRTTCKCHNCLSALQPERRGVDLVINKYSEINSKVHHAYREQGHKKVWELAEEILRKN